MLPHKRHLNRLICKFVCTFYITGTGKNFVIFLYFFHQTCAFKTFLLVSIYTYTKWAGALYKHKQNKLTDFENQSGGGEFLCWGGAQNRWTLTVNRCNSFTPNQTIFTEKQLQPTVLAVLFFNLLYRMGDNDQVAWWGHLCAKKRCKSYFSIESLA